MASVIASGCTDETRATPEETFTTIAFGELPSVVVAQGDFMWALDRRGSTIAKVDPETNEVAGKIDLGDEFRDPWDLVAGNGSLWVTVPNKEVLLEIDPETLDVANEIDLGVFASDVYFAAGSLWVQRNRDIARIDPDTRSVIATIPYRGRNTHVADLVEDDGVIWLVSDHAEYIAGGGGNSTFRVSAQLLRISPTRNSIESRLSLGSSYTRGAVNPVIGDIEVTEDGLWMSRVHERRLVLVEPASGELLLQFVVGIFEHPWEFAVVDGDLWVGELNGDEAAHIDTETRDRTVVNLGTEEASFVGEGFGSAWFPLPGRPPDGGRIVRLDPP